MGFCDVSDVVIPKVGLLAEPGGAGDIRSWYLTPHKLHTSHAVTGAVCVAAAAVINGTIAQRLARSDHANPRNVVIEHPAGKILIRLETKTTGPSDRYCDGNHTDRAIDYARQGYGSKLMDLSDLPNGDDKPSWNLCN